MPHFEGLDGRFLGFLVLGFFIFFWLLFCKMTLDFKKNQAQVIGVCYRTFKVGNLHLLLGMDISIFSSEPT